MVTVRVTPLLAWEKAEELSLLELDSANSKNQALTFLCSGKETEVTWTYSKKAVKSANKGTEAAEEPTGSLTVYMPLKEFKQPITQLSFLRH